MFVHYTSLTTRASLPFKPIAKTLKALLRAPDLFEAFRSPAVVSAAENSGEPVELHQLVYPVVADERLSDKQDQVGIIYLSMCAAELRV